MVMREEFVYSAPEFWGSQLDSTAIRMCEGNIWHFVARERFEGYLDTMAGIKFVFRKL